MIAWTDRGNSVNSDKNKSNGIMVDVTCNCYGVTERKVHHASKEAWEQEEKQGYFMA